MENTPNPKDITHGLIVVDLEEKGEMLEIHHFCGYWNEPTDNDIEALREELKTDPDFGLTDKIHKMSIVHAPDTIVELYVNDIIKGNDE